MQINLYVKAMKITALLLSICFTQAWATAFSQQVSLRVKNAPLPEVIQSIRQQSGYAFLFDAAYMRQAKPVTLSVQDMPMEEALKLVFKDQPFTYSIREADKAIVIKEKDKSILDRVREAVGANDHDDVQTGHALSQQIISGRVIDTLGQPIAGATITARFKRPDGTDAIYRVSTNGNGLFTLRDVPTSATLSISSVGYLPLEISAGQNLAALILKASKSPLDEVQVIAYGSTSKRFQTGNVTTVTAAEIERQPVNNPLLALQGRVPGMFITQSSGFAGSGVKVLIQGQNSMYNGNDPFYVVDGVPYPSQLIRNLGSVLGDSKSAGYSANAYGNPLNFLNPADIESISILKDADATAIYGSRAANGAILITTKKGAAGRTSVNFNLQQGWGTAPQRLDLMNTQQYVEMRREAFKNDGIEPSATDYDVNGFWDADRYTDWQKELIGGTSQYTDAQTSISGGTANTQYLLGAGYHRETTVFPGDYDDKKGSVHFNVNSASPNQKLKIQFLGSYLIDNNQLPPVDLTKYIFMAPNAPALYNADGSLNWAPNASGISSWDNPLRYTEGKYRNKTQNLVSNAILGYQITPDLEIRSSLGYTNMQSNEISFSPLTAYKPERRASTTRSVVYGDNNNNSWIIEPQLNYQKKINKGFLDALLGSTLQQTNSKGQQLWGRGYSSDQVMEDISAAASITPYANTIATVYKYNAVFARVNYRWQDKYIVNLSVRRDGSSRFGAENRFHNFASAGAAWIFTEEPFMKNLSWLSYGKLRGSYGSTGSDQIGEYQYMSLYSPISVDVPYQGVAASGTNSIANPYLQWEATKKLQGGLEMSFLNDRLSFTANYFRNRSSNQLLSYSLPVITGVGSVTANFPATVQNTGWELTLQSTNIKSKKFSWSSSINLTMNKNKLVAFPGIEQSSYVTTILLGEPLATERLYASLGVDPATGIFMFADKSGNPTSNPSQEDKTVLINPDPNYYGGFQNSLNYKGFQLDVLFQFVKQRGENSLGDVPGLIGGGYNNQKTNILDRWQKKGDIAPFQKYTTTYDLDVPWIIRGQSDAAWEDASYIRLKNLSLSWQLPQSWQQRLKLQNSRLYVQGNNLLTITNYSGLDPETKSSTTLPPLRVITMGIQVTL